MPDLLNEKEQVELTLIAQLQAMGWQFLAGDIDVPYLTEGESCVSNGLDKQPL